MYVRASAHSEQTIKQLFIEYGWDRVDFLSSLRQFNYVQFCISLLCVRSPTFPIHIHLFCTLLPSVESNRIESSWIGSDGIMDLCYSIIIPDYPENKSENNKCKCDRRRKNKKIRKSRIEIRLKPQHVRFSHFCRSRASLCRFGVFLSHVKEKTQTEPWNELKMLNFFFGSAPIGSIIHQCRNNRSAEPPQTVSLLLHVFA